MITADIPAAERKARIMVLEDDMLNALLIEDTLQFAGHEVAGPAKTIAQALDILDHSPIDAAILDLQLEDGVSFGVGKRLEELHIPWAIATAHAPSFVLPQFSHVRLLIKPFAVTALLDTVDGLLAERAHDGH